MITNLMPEFNLIPVFIVGLLGGVHCAGMCGGIVGAISLAPAAKTGAQNWRYHLAYNAGRIASYALAGGLAGMVGAGGQALGGALPIQQILYLLANLMLLSLGLHLAGVWHGILQLERAGSVVWRSLQPYTKQVMTMNSSAGVFMLGGLWGWLPCGLVYSVLFTALMSGSALQGALLMLAFGLGTLPNLLVMGLFAGRLKPFLTRTPVRVMAGLLVAAFGVAGLVVLGASWFGFGAESAIHAH